MTIMTIINNQVFHQVLDQVRDQVTYQFEEQS